MAVSKTDVLARFAEFAPIADAEWTAVIADAVLQINPTAWGSKADLGTIYLAAHLLGSAHPGLIPTGRIVRENLDGAGYTYQVPNHAPAEDDLDATPYGRLYKALRAQVSRARAFVP